MKEEEVLLDPDGTIPAEDEEDRKRTYVLYVLDRSGSMLSVRKEIVEGFNQHLKEIKAQARKGGETRVGLVTFSDSPKTVIWAREASDTRPLKLSEYAPEGSTAMLDAVGNILDMARSLPGYDKPNTSFLCIVLSDGYENASVSETYETIRTRIEGLQETGRWEFAYIGSNQDLSRVRKDTGIAGGVSFAGGVVGMSAVTSASASALGGYFSARAGGQSSSGIYASTTQSLYDASAQRVEVQSNWTNAAPGTVEQKPSPGEGKEEEKRKGTAKAGD